MFDESENKPRKLKSKRLCDVAPSKKSKEPDAAQFRAIYSEADDAVPPEFDGEYDPDYIGTRRRTGSRAVSDGHASRKVFVSSGHSERSENEAAFEAALRILSYGANTRRRLSGKLSDRGFSDEAVLSACDKLEAQGILSDRREIGGAVMSLAKRYGPRRIPIELKKLGFDDELIRAVDYEELEIDFSAVCKSMSRSREKDEKLYNSLLRRGFTDAQIKAAFRDEYDK